MARIYDIGPFRLDSRTGVLTRDGAPTPLGPRAAAVLTALVERSPEYLAKDDLLRAAWPGVVVEEGNLAVQISAIRRALAATLGGKHWIETLAKRGYRFVGPVTALPDDPLGPPPTQKRSNLTAPLTSFIGRERELVEIKRLLPSHRLVTIVGAGGIGKTRLALQAAAEVIDAYRDGVWLVELGSIGNPLLVPMSVAQAFGVKELKDTPLVDSLCTHLAARQVLLIIDNCEHLLDVCARLVAAILRGAPATTIIATSREPLHVEGEQTYPVHALSLPELPASAEAAARSDAVQLFVERARQQLPDFQLTTARAPAIAQLCIHLDGIPLALELAAARVRFLSVDEINARLHDRFRLLVGGSRTSLPRQQTLRALLDWSYDLLTEAEKRLLLRLSVFAGGWTLEAAEQVCADEEMKGSDIFVLLASLADKSLVVAEQPGTQARFRLLETLRQYAGEKLPERPDGEAVRARHRDYFLALAQEAERNLMGAEQAVWLLRLESEHENLRASFEASLGEPGSAAAFRLCGALWRFWLTRGHIAEGREWCARVLARPHDEAHAKERASALNTAGILAFYQSDYATAKALHREALAIHRQLNRRRAIAASLNSLANVFYDEGAYDEARALHEESLAIKRELGDRKGMAASLNNLGNVALDRCEFASARALYEESATIQRALGDRGDMGTVLCNLGITHYELGEYERAQALHEESLAIMRELGDRAGISQALTNLGNLAFERADFATARGLHEESLTIDRELGDRWAVAYSLEGLAAIAAGLGITPRAARLWGAAERLRTELGAPLAPRDRPRHDRHVTAARAAMADDAAFDHAWQEGRALTLEEAIEVALQP